MEEEQAVGREGTLCPFSLRPAEHGVGADNLSTTNHSCTLCCNLLHQESSPPHAR